MSNMLAPYLIALVLVWGVAALALVVIIVVVARIALAKARAEDIPEVLSGLAALVGALPWRGQAKGLPTMNQSLLRELRAAPPAEPSGAVSTEGDLVEVKPR